VKMDRKLGFSNEENRPLRAHVWLGSWFKGEAHNPKYHLH